MKLVDVSMGFVNTDGRECECDGNVMGTMGREWRTRFNHLNG